MAGNPLALSGKHHWPPNRVNVAAVFEVTPTLGATLPYPAPAPHTPACHMHARTHAGKASLRRRRVHT